MVPTKVRNGLTLVAAAAVMTVSAVASAQPWWGRRFGPDLLQTMSVGARAVGMGGAASVIVNDASATFWNPARLQTIDRNQIEFEMRSMVQNHVVRFGPEDNVSSHLSVKMRDPQISFAAMAIPLRFRTKRWVEADGERQRRTVSLNLGTVGISYSQGGYANLLVDSDVVSGGIHTIENINTIVRNSYVTLAYGREDTIQKGRAILSSGIGYFVVNQNQSQVQLTTLTDETGAVITTTPGGYRDVGEGQGVIVGLTYQPRTPVKGTGGETGGARGGGGLAAQQQWNPSPWTFGFTYRTGPTVKKLGDQGKLFNKELPDRLTVGAAYFMPMSASRTLLLAGELQHYGSANSQDELDVRRAVTNIHLGAEYVPNADKREYRTPVRVGFRTIANANDRLFTRDNAISVGAGYQSHYAGTTNLHYSVEGALEFLTNSKLVLYTVSGRFRF